MILRAFRAFGVTSSPGWLMPAPPSTGCPLAAVTGTVHGKTSLQLLGFGASFVPGTRPKWC